MRYLERRLRIMRNSNECESSESLRPCRVILPTAGSMLKEGVATIPFEIRSQSCLLTTGAI